MKTFAVVGMGSIAKRHLTNLRFLHPEANIYAVSASGKNVGKPEYADAVITLEQLIEYRPDYVVIASPASHHIDVACHLLTHNIAVLIEKPLAHNAESCQKLLSFCQNKNLPPIAVGYCLRFLPSTLVVKEHLDKKLLGNVYSVHASVGQYLPEWRGDKNYRESVSASKSLGGGVLLELSHELDYLQFLLGDLALQFSWLRTTGELDVEVEDMADLVLVNEENVHVTVHLDFIQKLVQRRCEFIGQHGRLVWDLIANTVTLYEATGEVCLYSEPEYSKNNMYLDMFRAFENISTGNSAMLSTPNSAAKVVRLIDDAKRLNKWRPKG